MLIFFTMGGAGFKSQDLAMAAATYITVFLLALSGVHLQLATAKGLFYYQEQISDDSECKGTPNTNKPWSGELTLVSQIANGSLYTAGDGDDQIYVLHVYGSAYDMGVAHGQLLKDQINKVIPAFYQHLEEEVEDAIKVLPREISDLIAKYGLDGALDLTYDLTKKYVSQYILDELRGLAKGSGVDYKMLLRLHMVPELVKAGCSMLGAWGSALADPSGTVQLRALDWDVDGPLQNAPTVVIYHPTEGHAFANVGWSGWIATISGISSKGMAISEKHSDVKFAGESRSGIPFNFLMRDVLQFDNSLFDSINRIQDAHRTCSIWLGVGDGNMKTFRLFEYSKSTAKCYDDKNVTEIDQKRFNQEHCSDTCVSNYTLPDLVYWGVHLGCWNQVLHENHGKINATSVIKMVGTVKTGNLQAVVYDLVGMEMYVANAKASNEQGPSDAFDRQFVKLNVGDLFKVAKPKML